MRERVCVNCKWWKRKGNGTLREEDSNYIGLCQINPPSIDGFPVSKHSDKCKEFEDKYKQN